MPDRRVLGAALIAVLSAARVVESAVAAEEPIFTDATAEAGIDFVYFNGASGEYYFPEIGGAGGALFDYDGDGDLDLYLVQGAMLGSGKTYADALFLLHGPLPLSDRLYRNDREVGADGRARLRFTDVTAASGLTAATGYGIKTAVGDYDSDGRPDLYVTNFGPNQLWRNRGNGTFKDMTARTSTDDPR